MFIDLESLNTFYKYWEHHRNMESIFHSEIEFTEPDWWMRRPMVIDLVFQREGQWLTGLVVANPNQGEEFVVRYMGCFSTLKSAETAVKFMKRLALKDPKGTMHLVEEAYLLFDY